MTQPKTHANTKMKSGDPRFAEDPRFAKDPRFKRDPRVRTSGNGGYYK